MGCSAELYRGLQEQEANEMIAILEDANISASKEINKEGLVTLIISKTDFSKAINTLKKNGMPREKLINIGEVYKKEGLISSPSEERARFLYARSQELSSTLSGLNDVLKARVHIAMPERKSLVKKASKPTASVWIWHQPGAETDSLIPQIKTAVAYSVEELDYSSVMVFLIPTNNFQKQAPISSEQSASQQKNTFNLLGLSTGNWLIIFGLLSSITVFFLIVLRIRNTRHA